MEQDLFIEVLRALNREKVQYLVIAGRACIFYGATEFTRDLDIWIDPDTENLTRIRQAMKHLGARQRFLPPLEQKYLLQGHAAHYMAGDFRIDILGRPPRVGKFSAALSIAESAVIGGVPCRIVDLANLVEMKKTQRARDYEVIQRLVDAVFEYADTHPDEQDTLGPWLAAELRTLDNLYKMSKEWGNGKIYLKQCRRPICKAVLDTDTFDEKSQECLLALLEKETQELRLRDREYWRQKIREIRKVAKNKSDNRDKVS